MRFFLVVGAGVGGVGGAGAALLERTSVLEDAGLRPCLVDVDVLAVRNLADFDSDGVVVLTGHEWLAILVLREGLPCLLHTARAGTGMELESVLSPKLGERAAELAAGAEPMQPREASELGQAVEGLAQRIAAAVRDALRMARVEPRRALLAGGPSMLHGIREGIAEAIEIDLEPALPGGGGEGLDAAPAHCAPVLGLARRVGALG